MDKTSEKIINLLMHSPNNTLMYLDEPYKELGISDDEFFRCVRHLENINLVDFISNQNGKHLGIQLTHQAVHAKEFKHEERVRSFKKWVVYSYLGGVATGVTVTLLAQFLATNGPIWIAKLIELLGSL